MSIEEAEYILNEAIISEPSTKSFTYISAESINAAINKLLAEKLTQETRIKELEAQIKYEKNRAFELANNKNAGKVFGIKYWDKNFKYLNKVVNPLFLLEN